MHTQGHKWVSFSLVILLAQPASSANKSTKWCKTIWKHTPNEPFGFTRYVILLSGYETWVTCWLICRAACDTVPLTGLLHSMLECATCNDRYYFRNSSFSVLQCFCLLDLDSSTFTDFLSELLTVIRKPIHYTKINLKLAPYLQGLHFLFEQFCFLFWCF